MLERLREPWSDRRAERMLGALASLVLLVIVLMIVFVAVRAWPSFAHNGLSWFTGKGDVDVQIGNQVNTGARPDVGRLPARGVAAHLGHHPHDRLRGRVRPGLLDAGRHLHRRVLPPALRRVIVPVVRLLAAVPSVIYGLIGILVLVPFVNDHLVSEARKKSVQYVINLSGTGLSSRS